MKTVLSIICSAAVLALLPANANLLNNGDFNTGDFTGWWGWAADPANQTLSIDSTYTYDGSPNAVGTSASASWQLSLGQNPAIGPDTPFNLSFVYSTTGNQTWGTAAVQIKYLDSGWNYLNYNWFTLYYQAPNPNTPGQWLNYNGNFTSVPGTAYLDFTFQIVDWTTFHVDNVAIEVVPEPSSAALLAGAGLALLIIRRRRA